MTIGDFANVGVDETFPLIYLTFNTIFGLLTQERQIECFQNVAAHLEPGGRFSIDCFVPDVRRFDHTNTRINVSSIDSVDQHSYEMTVYDPVRQRLSTHMVKRLAGGQTRLAGVIRKPLRLVRPAAVHRSIDQPRVGLSQAWIAQTASSAASSPS